MFGLILINSAHGYNRYVHRIVSYDQLSIYDIIATYSVNACDVFRQLILKS